MATSISFTGVSLADAQMYESALADVQQGEIGSAVVKIKNILREDPKNLPTRLLYAEILQQYGEFTAAQEQYEKALELNADENLVVIPLTRILLIQGRFQEVLDVATVLNRPFDIQIQLMQARGDAFLGLRDYANAEREYRRVLQQRNDDIIALIGLAQIEFSKGNSDAFITQIESAKAIHPDNDTLWYMEGRFEQKQRNIGKANELFSTAIRLNPDNFDARKARAAIALDEGDARSAASDISFMLAKVEDDPYTLFLNALLLRQQGEFENANIILSELSNKFSIVPSDVLDQHYDLKKAKAITEFLLENYPSAENVLTQMIASAPSDPELRGLMARTLYAQGQTRRALDHFQIIPINELNLETATLYVLSLFETEKYFDLVSLYDRLPEEFQQISQIKNMFAIATINTQQGSTLDLSKKDQSQRLISGYGFLQAGDIANAQKVAEQLDDDSKEYLNFKGTVELALGNWDAALNKFEAALRFDENDHIVNLNIVQVLIAQGQLGRANEILVAQESNFPDDQRVKFQIARVAQLSGDYSRASQYYQAINVENPLEINTLYNWLDVSLSANRFNQALTIARQLESINKFSTAMLIGKAKAQIGLDDRMGAIRSLRVLLGLVGESAPHLIEIGELMATLGEQEGLSEVINRLNRQTNHKQSVDRLRVLQFSNSGKLEEAIRLAKRVAADTRLDADYWQLSQLYFETGDMPQAIQFAETAVQLGRSNKYIPYLTSLYWRNSKQEEAETLLREWLNENPTDGAIRRVLANFYQQLGRVDDAKNQYRMLISKEPEDIFSIINLSTLTVIDGAFQQATTLLDSLPSLYSEDPVVIDLKGWLMFQSGNKQEGLALMRESYARNARNPINLYHLGMALIDQNRTDQGEQMLKRYLELATPASTNYQASARAQLNGV